MVRRLRVKYPGAIHHVLNRGDQRKVFFRDATTWRGLLTQTTVMLSWIEERLQSSTRGHLTHLLHRTSTSQRIIPIKVACGDRMAIPLTDTFPNYA